MPPPTDPVRLHRRQVLAHRLEKLFEAGARVVALGCGDVENALALAAGGVSLLVLEPDPGRLEAARAAVPGSERGRMPRFEIGGAGTLVGAGRLFDGAYSGPGAIDGSRWAELAPALARSLRPEAPLVLALSRPPARARRDLEREFRWERRFALGVVVRARMGGGWAARNPQSFALLAVLERIVRGWPLIRSLGEHEVWEGVALAGPRGGGGTGERLSSP